MRHNELKRFEQPVFNTFKDILSPKVSGDVEMLK